MSKILTPVDKDITLVVGDVHCGPGQNLRRADWLGWAIKDIQPTRVVFIGDFLTLDSLSGWDKDKRKKMEGRRYAKDIESGKEFLERMYDAMGWEPGLTGPPFILTEGNHEDRLWRYLDKDPSFSEHVDYRKDLGLIQRGWKVVPYKEDFRHKGVCYTHIPITAAGRPISRKDICGAALDTYGVPVIFGHTHRLANAQLHRKGTAHLQEALNVGCYFEHIDDYAQGSQTNYWRGLVVIDHYQTGRFGFRTIPMSELRKLYRGRAT